MTCLYMLYDEHDRPIYVGIGDRTRPYDSQRKHGGRVEIVASGLDRLILAPKLEAVLIRILGREGLDKFGMLKNRLTRGPGGRAWTKPVAKPAATQAYLERLAFDLGASNSAVMGWRYRGKVPHDWRQRLQRAAADKGVHIPDDVFDHFQPIREGTPRGKRPSRAKGGPVVSAG